MKGNAVDDVVFEKDPNTDSPSGSWKLTATTNVIAGAPPKEEPKIERRRLACRPSRRSRTRNYRRRTGEAEIKLPKVRQIGENAAKATALSDR